MINSLQQNYWDGFGSSLPHLPDPRNSLYIAPEKEIPTLDAKLD